MTRLELSKLGKRMSIRQQALATAQIYLRRYYLTMPIRSTNPYLVLSTAFYLACKVEECPHHIRLVVAEARNFWPDMLTSETAALGECEFSLISEMGSQLLVHHPYRALQELQGVLQLSVDEMSLAWNIVNDGFLTDVVLCYAPCVVAVTAAFLAVVIKPSSSGGGAAGNMHQQVQGALGSIASGTSGGGGATTAGALAGTAPSTPAAGQGAAATSGASPATSSPRIQKLLTWLAESSIDIEAIVDCIQELISLYEVWDGYKEALCKEPIARFVKGRSATLEK
jgi:cyclin-C